MWGRGYTISPYQSQEGVAHLPEVAIHKLNITDTITPIIFFLVLVPSNQTFELTGVSKEFGSWQETEFSIQINEFELNQEKRTMGVETMSFPEMHLFFISIIQ